MFTIILVLLAILVAISFLRKSQTNLHSHWNILIDTFKYSTKDFYEQLTQELQSHGIDNVQIEEKNLSIGGALSGKRVYLRVQWKEYSYDCCCAPFGNGTFVSWWLYSEKTGTEKILAGMPLIGNFLVKVFFPETYYRIDTSSMFMTYAQASVTKVIDSITKETAFKMNDEERKPIMKNIFDR